MVSSVHCNFITLTLSMSLGFESSIDLKLVFPEVTSKLEMIDPIPDNCLLT